MLCICMCISKLLSHPHYAYVVSLSRQSKPQSRATDWIGLDSPELAAMLLMAMMMTNFSMRTISPLPPTSVEKLPLVPRELLDEMVD